MRSHPPSSGCAPRRTSVRIPLLPGGSGFALMVNGSVEPKFCGATVPSTRAVGGVVDGSGDAGNAGEAAGMVAVGDAVAPGAVLVARTWGARAGSSSHAAAVSATNNNAATQRSGND